MNPFRKADSCMNFETVKLEQQRNTLRLMLVEDIPELAVNVRCPRHTGCAVRASSEDFAHNLVRALEPPGRWPPRLSCTPLRLLLVQIWSVGDVEYWAPWSCKHTDTGTVTRAHIRQRVEIIYDCAGLRLWCTQNGGVPTSACTHAEDQLYAGTVAMG